MSIKKKSLISQRLIGRTGVSNVQESIDALANTASDLSPDGGLYVIVLDKPDAFSTKFKVIRDLMDLDFIYSSRAIQQNPKLATELASIVEHMKAINKIVGKRKKMYREQKNEK